MTEHAEEAVTPRHAGFWIRFAATLLDLIIMGVPVVLLVSVIFGLDLESKDRAFSVTDILSPTNLLQAALLAIITVLLWVNWDGRTPGKKLTSIRIVSYPDYGGLSYWTATVRSLIGVASALPLLVGYIPIAIMIGTRGDKRGYHDLIAGTCVVHDG